jgi:hypothetical protein
MGWFQRADRIPSPPYHLLDFDRAAGEYASRYRSARNPNRTPVTKSGIAISVAAVESGGVRTVLYVPLTKDERVVGVFVIFRQEVRPFTEKQIALAETLRPRRLSRWKTLA